MQDTISALGGRHSYRNSTTIATTICKTSPGILHSVTINKTGAAANVLTIYDNTAASGNKIATILTTITNAPLTLIYDLAFTTGLTIDVTVGTAADITVTFI